MYAYNCLSSLKFGKCHILHDDIYCSTRNFILNQGKMYLNSVQFALGHSNSSPNFHNNPNSDCLLLCFFPILLCNQQLKLKKKLLTTFALGF